MSGRDDEATASESDLDDEQLKAVVAALQQEYAKELPAQLLEVERAYASALEQKGDDHKLEEATQIAHRLLGTTGSYGFADISQVMERLENASKALLGKTQANLEQCQIDGLWHDIEEALAALKRLQS
ncbi:MAG TPA: Hpt domain-containing protein [Candidatus Obscuribacterales bacterium]